MWDTVNIIIFKVVIVCFNTNTFALLQVLYEIVYAFGNVSTSFSIFTMIPRQHINEKESFYNITTSVLVVEEDGSVLDPLSWLDVHTSEFALEVFM